METPGKATEYAGKATDSPGKATDSVELPRAWLSQFDGSNLEAKLQVAAVLGTVDDAGWPHLTYLSAGEVLAHGGQRLSFGLWPASRSTANLRRLGHAVLQAVADGAVWETRVVARARADADDL